MTDFNDVVVAVDGSDNAMRAARFAARMARAADCPLKLLFVFPTLGSEVIGLASLSPEEIEAARDDAARRAFDAVLREVSTSDAPPAEVVRLGDPAEEIIDFAESNPRTLLVLGRRGMGRLKSLLLGSVSEKVVRHTRGAVTLVG